MVLDSYFNPREWKRTYGDIFSITIYGKTMVVINSYEALKEMLIHKSDHFSGKHFNQPYSLLSGIKRSSSCDPLPE